MHDNLIAVLKDLKKCMEIHGTIFEAKDASRIPTRMVLIDPLLRALGWDTDNPALVRPEYYIGKDGKGWIDYALMRQGHQEPVAIIEARKLGSTLAKKQKTMWLTYASDYDPGIPYAGFTDGDHWQLYDVFKQAPLENRCILNISIRTDPLHQCALALLSLWQLNLASSNPVEAPKPLSHSKPDCISIPIPTPPDSA